MFNKISRYRNLPDVVIKDETGRITGSKSLRLIPEADGTFLHTVEQGDRLDHLAYRYYRQTRKWWRVCDANPAYPSPQSLIGKDPLVTDRFPLPGETGSTEPQWHNLLPALRRTPGVEDAWVEAAESFLSQNQVIGGQPVTVVVPRYARAIVVRYNRLNVTAHELADVMVAAGFSPGAPENIGRIGKQIVIPPDVRT